MKLTIGMATTNDFDGTYFTLQALRLYHIPREEQEVELLVVDNSPQTNHGQMVSGQCQHVGARYIPMPQMAGTSQSRNRVFEEAKGDVVMCIDPHVLLVPDAIDRLLEYIEQRKMDHGLYSGPLLYDDGRNVSTHFNCVWRAEMLGTWGAAWECCSGGLHFSCVEDRRNPAGMVIKPLSLADGRTPVSFCPKCNEEIPLVAWNGHEGMLESSGYRRLGMSLDESQFEIPAQGLGLFLCKKDAWLGFHKYARGFGGEEVNIHDLYRMHGEKCWCLPFMRWVHKFGRGAGVPYPLRRYDRVRNYVLWYQLLGKPLEEVHTHFVGNRLMTQEEWNYLIEDPVGHVEPPASSECSSCGGGPKTDLTEIKSVQSCYDTLKSTPRDFDQHMETLRSLADKCETVTEYSIRRESFVALVASAARKVISHNREKDILYVGKLLDYVRKEQPEREFKWETECMPAVHVPEETDLLFLNTRHTGEQLTKELTALAPMVRHYIVIHNTQIYGNKGEDGQPGLLVALTKFLRLPENKKWSVITHTNTQYGLTVLSCHDEDKPKLPGIITRAFNYTSAIAAHVADQRAKVTPEQYEARLDICSTCDQRSGEDCTVCGCHLPVAASWQSKDCPLARWPDLNVSQ